MGISKHIAMFLNTLFCPFEHVSKIYLQIHIYLPNGQILEPLSYTCMVCWSHLIPNIHQTLPTNTYKLLDMVVHYMCKQCHQISISMNQPAFWIFKS